MNPMFIVAIPLVLVIVGMVLNSTGLSFDQPPSSPEQDPAKRAAAESEGYRRFFDRQRSRAVKRQKRVGQYAWLLMAAIIGSFIWLYMYTVKTTTAATQIVTLQTLPTEDGKEMVLSITLKDGSNVKYLIKSPQADALEAARKEGISNEKVSSYEISQIGTGLNIGESPLPVGVAVKIAN
jgi:multidrug efflux pump subunit AcrB